MTVITIHSPTSVDKLRATVETSADPTGSTVSWQLTATDATPAADSWVAGAWSGSYSGGKATTISPVLTSGLGASAGTRYTAWVRWTVGAETPERIAGDVLIGGS